jgi:hypothetical protein
MKTYLHALCWAAAMLAVAAAGVFGAIDQSSTTTLLIALPAAAWIALQGKPCRLGRGKAGR